MATCRFQEYKAVDVNEVLPLGWTLVLFETRRLPTATVGFDDVGDLGAEAGASIPRGIQIERHRTVLCPDHAMYVAQLCGVLPPSACAEPAATGYAGCG